MIRFFNLLIFAFLLLINLNTYAQIWLRNMPKDKVALKDYQTAFYDYWKDKPVEKGQGYSLFKRWEWFWEQRILPDGTFPEPTKTRDEWLKYEQSRSYLKYRNTSSANWQFKGPSTTPGGYNGLGRVNCIAFHPTIANTFWVGTPAGGIWKTIDGGLSWTTNTDNLPVLGVSDIAIDKLNPNIMYIATGDGDLGNLSGLTGGDINGDTKSIGVLKSTNGGLTWATTDLNWSVTAPKSIRRLIINPNNTQILVAATSDGIYQTLNGGLNWTRTQSGYFMDIEFKPGDPNIVYSSTFNTAGNSQIYRSINGGQSWSLITSFSNVIRIDLAVTPASPNLVDAVCVNTSSGLAGLWYSNNSGATFSQYFFDNNCTDNLLNGDKNASGCGGQGHYDLAYAINPNNANIIWLGGINTYRSTDGGSNWQLKTFWNSGSENPGVATVHADKHFIAFHPLLNNTVFECNDGGLYKTTDGGNTWTDLSNGLGISQIYRIGVSQTINNNIICGLQDNGSREIYNNQWYEQTGGDGMECIIDYSNANTEYASYANGKIYRTYDFWKNQTTISNNIPGQPQGAWVTPFVMHPTNPNILYAGYNKIYRSANQGDSWVAISPDLSSDELRSLCIAPSNPNKIYAATFNELFVTSNGGSTWITLSLNDPKSRISYITVNPTNAEELFITLSGYSAGNKVLKSSNGGTNWINYSGTLPNVPVNCITYQKNSNEALYIGTDVGVFYTNGSMSDWIPYQTGLPNVVVTELEISYNNNKLWAATFGRGLWNTDLYSISTNLDQLTNEKNILVYPNPTSGQFIISSAQERIYAVVIYNSTGSKVYHKNYNTTSNISINLESGGDGVYNVQIFLSNNKVVNKKIILTKTNKVM
jgi:photosystem II stability/assembly factor-like uncharacterized protein